MSISSSAHAADQSGGAEPFRMVVEEGKIREFARATRSRSAEHFRPRDPVSPVTFLACCALWMGEENSAWQGVTRDFANILHGEQEFSFHGPPPVAGTELIGLQSIDRTYEKVGARGGAMTFTEVVTRFRKPSSERAVVEMRSVSIYKHPGSAAAATPVRPATAMTGWGREGPLAAAAGHDLNYLALTGVLHAIGPDGAPPPPLTLVGDYGGGSMFCVTGILAALWERERSGRGQVVDVAMVDGIGVLAQKVWAMRGAGTWSEERHANLLDGGAPFYDTYACVDGRYVAVAAIERQFFAELLKGLGLGSPSDFGDQYDRAAWPRLRESIRGAIASRTRDEWALVFDGTDACVTPVLTLTEALSHPHAVARSAFVTIDGLDQPAPAPRFERTPLPVPASPGQDEDGGLRAVLRRWQDG